MSERLELLLVEDDMVTSEVLSLTLAQDGWQVSTAASGEAALAYLQCTAPLPAVVLCDQKLPGLCGAALADTVLHLYQDAGAQPPALLAMSASRADVPAGYHGLLLKPFSAAELRFAWNSNRSAGRFQADSTKEESRALQVLDENVVHNLLQSMGPNRLRELYAFALKDAADRIGRMQAAIASSDVRALASEAHMLKGAADMVGAQRLASLAGHFEAPVLADSETDRASTRKMAMLSAALDDIERMLETHFPAQR